MYTSMEEWPKLTKTKKRLKSSHIKALARLAESHTVTNQVNVSSSSAMRDFNRLSFLALILAVGSAAGMPRQRFKSQRQVELTTPYPAAGFRPKIPFDLPNEQQPEVAEFEPEQFITTTTTAGEDLTPTEPLATSEIDRKVNQRIPAITYGAPDLDVEQRLGEEDTVEVVAESPAKEFKPPQSEAAQDFAIKSVGPTGEQRPVVDLPTLGEAVSELPTVDELQTDLVRVTPDATYGAPAATYGAPVQRHNVELEEEESQVELVGESALAEGYTSNRFILLPIGGHSGRLVLAVQQPQRRGARSERLRRF